MNVLTSLDVLIGLIVIFLVISLACTVINEWIDALLHTRAQQLRNSISQMLASANDNSLGQKFHTHPLIQALERDTNVWGAYKRRDKPTYISNRTFRQVLFDILNKLVADHPINFDGTLEEIEQSLNTLPDSDLKTRLLSILNEVKVTVQDASKRVEAFRKAIDQWFDESMERTSDWYKRRVQLWTFFSGIAFCTLLNIDTLTITQYLWQNPEARQVYLQAANSLISNASTDSLKKELAGKDSIQLNNLGHKVGTLLINLREEVTQNTTIPLGWQLEKFPICTKDNLVTWLAYWIRKLAGLLISIGAISAGAPFWFDMLKNVVNIRNALKSKTLGKDS